jgi:hypothetical protein
VGDLVDYLRDKLDACTCSQYMIGRAEIGYYWINDWRPGCPQHPTDPFVEGNRQQLDLIYAANARIEAARKRWWRR